MYEWPYELRIDLRLRILGNQEISGNENFVNTNKELLNRNVTFPVVPYFKRKLELVSNIL